MRGSDADWCRARRVGDARCVSPCMLCVCHAALGMVHGFTGRRTTIAFCHRLWTCVCSSALHRRSTATTATLLLISLMFFLFVSRDTNVLDTIPRHTVPAVFSFFVFSATPSLPSFGREDPKGNGFLAIPFFRERKRTGP